ncbi:ChpI protein [Flexivirga oryzae]|uniref:Putative transcriptional regulator n=1 Tax=Flexivirga oryzae TaxID=1794944 RepID=A0A839NF19_9MICO|nr:ChpI protein [Flexivirga oryzae]MBB2893102.1 putative transcriptional regulator [Flexivirga oryzae]
MKTAVSIPDDVFRDADETATRLGWSRSQLYTRAIRDFLEGQEDDPVTAALDALAEDAAVTPNTGRALIESGAWEW